MKSVVAAGLLLVAGCKSTDAFMEEPPRATFLASGQPKDVAFCIGIAAAAPAHDDGGGRFTLRVPTMYGGSGEAFSIRPEGAGSAVQYRRAKGLMAGRQTWKKCLM